MVAMNYAVMAADLVVRKRFGRMVALRDGIYTDVPLTEGRAKVKHVDVEALYDVASYRPKVWEVDGKPMFLS
jgi:6-phosphofructokinase 1